MYFYLHLMFFNLSPFQLQIERKYYIILRFFFYTCIFIIIFSSGFSLSFCYFLKDFFYFLFFFFIFFFFSFSFIFPSTRSITKSHIIAPTLFSLNKASTSTVHWLFRCQYPTIIPRGTYNAMKIIANSIIFAPRSGSRKGSRSINKLY